MTHLYVAEPCNDSYILLESPKLVIGRNSDKSKPYELIGNKVLLPHKELSRSQIELSCDDNTLNITNIGRNKVIILLQAYDSGDSSGDGNNKETCSRKQIIVQSNESVNGISFPCIVSIRSHSFTDHYGTYYYGCPLFPPLEVLPIGGMVASVTQLLEKIEARLSFSSAQSDNPEQLTHLNIIFNRYNCPQLALAEFIDCTNPKILGPLTDEDKKVVDLEPYYITLTDITNRLQEAESIDGVELSIEQDIYRFEKPPCFPEHQIAYEEACVSDCQESTNNKQLTYKQFIDLFLTDTAILSINANLQGLFEESMSAQSLAAIRPEILEWTITKSSIVLEDGTLCCQPDIGRLKSYYSRHKCLLIVYEGSESQDWVTTILEPNTENNALFILMQALLGVEKPTYIMSKKQFSGFIYHQSLDKLSHFIFPPSKVADSEIKAAKEPSLRQSVPSNATKHAEEDEGVIDISDSESSLPSSERATEHAKPAEPASSSTPQQPSQPQGLPAFTRRKMIKVGLPVLKIRDGYGIIDCDDISISIWRKLVDSINNDNPGPYLAFRICENNAE